MCYARRKTAIISAIINSAASRRRTHSRISGRNNPDRIIVKKQKGAMDLSIVKQRM